MHRITLIGTALIWGTIFIPFQSVSARGLSDQVCEIIQNITISARPQRVICRREFLWGQNALVRFYTNRAFRPAWSVDDGPLPQAAILVKEIHEADSDGLRPEDYHLANIEDLLGKIRHKKITNEPLAPKNLADLDLLLTDAFLLYGSHLLAGRVNPETVNSEWAIERREADLAEMLQTALAANQIDRALEDLRPRHAGYASLKRALLRYRDILKMGGWPLVAEGPKMQQGDRGPRVGALRSRLMATGDLNALLETDHDLFDETLERAVRRFQERHGLEVDGVVNPATLKALNVPVKERVHQIELNTERWRWLPLELGRRYILVNVANFELDVVENGKIMMTMRVIVGMRYRQTPVFTGKMTHIELNPYWHIPPGIAIEDILPKIRQDPHYLARQHILVFRSWDAQAPEIHPELVDWSQITAENFSFKLRQEPGPSNALGLLKFMFPNKFNVYLHDTPAGELFQKTERSFSSGCIRIEKPVDLAEYLLRGDSRWIRERIIAAIDSTKTQTIAIPDAIPVHLLYWTSWADPDGTIHFRDDIYGRDKRLEEAFKEKPPTPYGP